MFEEIGKKAGLPLTVIESVLKDDINQVFENVAKNLSMGKTIYTTIPNNSTALYEFSNGVMKKCDSNKNVYSLDLDENVFRMNKSGDLVIDRKATKLYKEEALKELKKTVKIKYDNICKDYKKEGHVYYANKALDENYIPTITLKDVTQNRFLELEDLDFINNRFNEEGLYVVKNGKYHEINIEKKIEKNHTVDKDKEDERNFASKMVKKYNLSREDVEEKIKEFMLEKSNEEGAVVYVGYDKEKDEYYMDYYIEGKFDEREIINKKTADNMEVGTFSTMGQDEFSRYSGYFAANDFEQELEDIIKNMSI